MSQAIANPDQRTDKRPRDTTVTSPAELVSDYTVTFLDAVADEIGISECTPRVIDVDENASGIQFLVSYPGDRRIVVGRDETSKDAGLFAFTFDAAEHPTIETVEAALELLKPTPVVRAEAVDSVSVHRQGEWWFVETNEQPSFSVRGDLGAKPYGPSPMESHVAREYGFGLPRERLLEALSYFASDGECGRVFEQLPACFESIRQQELVRGRTWSGRFTDFQWEHIPEVCNGLFVRGSVRHRGCEHDMLSLGDTWHRVYTHDVTVYQPIPTTYSNSEMLVSRGKDAD